MCCHKKKKKFTLSNPTPPTTNASHSSAFHHSYGDNYNEQIELEQLRLLETAREISKLEEETRQTNLAIAQQKQDQVLAVVVVGVVVVVVVLMILTL